jgi:predicted acyltransferase
VTTAARPGGNATTSRLVSLDVTRGLAVVGMLLVNNPGINPGHPMLLKHPEWNGFTVADVVFPLFLFCIGASMTLSNKGPGTGAKVWPMVRRCLILFAIGMALSFLKSHNLAFAGVLQHIAVTSLIAWFVLRLPRRGQWAVAGLILMAGAVVGLVWGFEQGSTIDAVIDRFLFGWDTAEGLPVWILSVVNVLAGAWIGAWFRQGDRSAIVRHLSVQALAPLAVGLALAPLIPVNKQMWTPTYALVSISASAAIMLAAYWAVDLRGVRRGVGWLREMGANPLAVYVACTALAALVPDDVRLSVVSWVADSVGNLAASLMWASAWVLLAWLIAHVLWRRHILVKL